MLWLSGVMAEAGEGLAAPDALAAALAYKQSALGSYPAGMADYAFFLENGLGGLPQVNDRVGSGNWEVVVHQVCPYT